jgi:hypothetical protein
MTDKQPNLVSIAGKAKDKSQNVEELHSILYEEAMAYCQQNRMTLAEVVGVLEMLKQDIIEEASYDG